ncbi:MAG: cytidylate kinase-like family protein [Roseburia sp.]|nr:cytidylate kinase-like family protein [Roseburia sp.]
MEQYVITISRQFGSMGRTIAERLSKELGIEYLDRDIVEATAKRMGESVRAISEAEESAGTFFLRRKYPFSMGIYSISDEIFAVQRNIIRDYAAKQSCIIVGRCADSILQDYRNHLSVYVYAPYEARFENCTGALMMEAKTAKRMLREVDAARENYQRKYCPEVRSVFDHKDLMIDSSRFGIEGSAALLADIVRKRWS